MDDQNPDPQLDQLDAGPGGSPAPSPAGETSAEGTGVYAVYDTAELRYVGGTHSTRKAANALKSERIGKGDRGRYEVREV